MRFQYIIAMCVSFGLLLITMSGYGQYREDMSLVLPQPVSRSAARLEKLRQIERMLPKQELIEPGTTEANGIDVHYDRLLHKRLVYEIKIREAMNEYYIISLNVYEQRAELRRYLRDKPISDAVKAFRESKPHEIDLDLRLAYSCWQTLLPDETQRLQITKWIDKQQISGVLEEFDIQIKNVENRRQLGKFLDTDDMEEVDRLLAMNDTSWEVVDVSDLAILEQEAVERLTSELENSELDN